uniref:Uncharacterized protein n=1 Tax=Rhizophora mucronata TaxID=61149 RepID=A0A2P2P038_RHIMU
MWIASIMLYQCYAWNYFRDQHFFLRFMLFTSDTHKTCYVCIDLFCIDIDGFGIWGGAFSGCSVVKGNCFGMLEYEASKPQMRPAIWGDSRESFGAFCPSTTL